MHAEDEVSAPSPQAGRGTVTDGTNSSLEGEVRLQRKHPGLAEIALCRPAARNALGWPMWRQLRQAFEEAATDDQIRTVVLTGTGGVFSAGGDLKSANDKVGEGSGQLASVARLRLAHEVISCLYRLPKPTIAAVEGYAIGIGWSLVLACDFVVSADNAFFWAPFTERGLVPDGGAAWFLVRRFGHHRAAAAVLLGERLSAPAAAQAGLVSRLVSAGNAVAEAEAIAAALMMRSNDALRLAKQLLGDAPESAFDDFLRHELHVAALAMSGPDAIEGRRAFREGRAPRYETVPGSNS